MMVDMKVNLKMEILMEKVKLNKYIYFFFIFKKIFK